MNRKIFATAGYNTDYIGPGRPEFNPKKPMRSFEDYLKEAAEGCMAQLQNSLFDEGIISNFMAARFIRQGNLAGFLPAVVPSLLHKPCYRAEGACGSGGLALTMAIKSILSGMADSVYVTGFEIQNSVKALYGADILAGAAYHSGERKDGHAFFFPGVFSHRAGAYYEKYGYDKSRRGMARWYENAILNARKNSKAQEFHNNKEKLFEMAMTAPNAKRFVEHLNLFDCSKVSDGASSIVICSEEGLKKMGVSSSAAVEIIGFNSAEGNITTKPDTLTELNCTAYSARQALKMAKVQTADINVLELHDCFSITGILALEAIGFASPGEGAEMVYEGNTKIDGELPVNPSGGLCGFGHPTGATGVRQMTDLLSQLTERSANQISLKRPFGLMVSMGGNDKTLSSLVVKKT